MKTKEKPLEESAKSQAFEFSVDYKPFETDLDYREYAEYGFERGFVAGHKVATKWKKAEDYFELPDNDRTVLVWINNTQNPQWSTYGLGSYIDDNWYLRGGRASHEIVEKWIEIPL